MAGYYPTDDDEEAQNGAGSLAGDAAAPAQASDLEDPQGDDTGTPENEGDETEGNDDGSQTALLPKSLLPGNQVQPGQMLTLKVVHVYDDEIEVECQGDDESGGEGYEGSAMDQAQDKLGAMATAGGA